MNKREILERAIELKECSEEFESVTFLDSDTEFFANVVEIIQRTAQEVPVQEQYVTLKIDSKEIAKVVINEINKQQRQSNATLVG